MSGCGMTWGCSQGHARWELGSRDISFTVNSAANLPALIDAIRPSPMLHEFVVYEPGSLKVEGEGRWRLPAADGSAPGRVADGRHRERRTLRHPRPRLRLVLE